MMTELIVAKFGGTSMEHRQAMLQSAKVTMSNPAVRLIVVSATSGTTTQLVDLTKVSAYGDWEKSLEICELIKKRHLQLAQEMGCDQTDLDMIQELCHEIQTKAQGMHLLREASLRSQDSLISIGERLSSILFAQALRGLSQKDVVLVDARTIMKTDDNFSKAEPEVDLIKLACEKEIIPLLIQGKLIVTQGFIGSTLEGITTTLGRGGSDYSAALFAEALTASAVQIWTDVSGVATTDPRVCSEAQIIHELSFAEAAELATFGAKVLHPATLWPAMRKHIPVFVGNTFKPDERGTWIRISTDQAPKVRAIAFRENQKLLTISSPSMLHAHGFLEKIFAVLSRHRISVDLVTTSEISVSLTIDHPTLLTHKVMDELATFAQVKLEENLSLIALIGNGMAYTPGLTAEVFNSISDFSIRLICLGASKHNFCFLVENQNAKDIVHSLHQRFLETAPKKKSDSQSPEIFK